MGTWLKLIIAIITWVPVYRIYTCNSHLVTHLQHISHDSMSTNVSHIDSDGHMYTHLKQPCACCVMYWVISLLFIYYISIILKHYSINYFYEKKYFTEASSHYMTFTIFFIVALRLLKSKRIFFYILIKRTNLTMWIHKIYVSIFLHNIRLMIKMEYKKNLREKPNKYHRR
jgi:hypothetical protein